MAGEVGGQVKPLPNGWVKLKVSQLIGEGWLEIGDGYRAKNSEMAETGIPFVRAGDVNGWVNTIGVDLLGEASLPHVGNKRSKSGDAVITTKGTIGRMALVRPDDPAFIYSPQLCFWRSLNPRKIDPSWLYYALHSEEMRHQMNWSAAQTDMAPYISLTDQRSVFEITLPPIDDQIAIGSVLLSLDAKIDLNRQMAATFEEMARTLFKSWFVDFDPVHAKSEGRNTGLPAGMAALFPDGFSDEGLPKGWAHRTVYDFSKVVYGAPFASSRFNSDGVGLPLIRVRDLTSHRPAIFTDEEHRVAHVIQPGDIVVGMDGEFRCHIWKGVPAYLNQRVCHFEPLVNIPNSFVALALETPLARFEQNAVGTTVIHLGKRDLDTVEMIWAGSALMVAFGSIADPLFARSVEVAQQARLLEQLRDTLLPKLLTGELRVADAETVIAAA